MNTAVNGRRFEHTVRHALEHDGYVCIRSAASKGPADLIAFKKGQTLLVSCKNHPGVLPPHERAALLHVAGLIDGVALHAYKPSRGRLAYRELTGQGPGMWQPWTTDQVAR